MSCSTFAPADLSVWQTTLPTRPKRCSFTRCVIRIYSESALTIAQLVLLNISDHFTRTQAQDALPDSRVFGLLFGKQVDQRIEIFQSSDVMYTLTPSGDVMIDKSLVQSQINLSTQPVFAWRAMVSTRTVTEVFEGYELLGWYATGQEQSEADMRIHQQVRLCCA